MSNLFLPLTLDLRLPSTGRIPVTASTIPNDEVPLLRGQHVPATEPEPEGPDVVRKTPIPWAQFAIVLFLEVAEPLASRVIFPFAPELVRSLDVVKDEADVSYYVGIVYSLSYVTEACTVLYWGRLSDHIGRKPVILTGLFGLSLSMYCFALSKTYWGLVFSRALNGALNGNMGTFRSMIAEMTDQTNLHLAYSHQTNAWSTGASLGSYIGGALSRPVERFPNVFGNSKFLKEYPYFLPCAIPATFTVITLLVAFFFLKETHPSPKPIREFLRGKQKRARPEEDPLLTSRSPRVLLRDLLTRDVVVACANYSFLVLLDISFRTLQPIFLSTPIAVGGLGLDPPAIGTVMSFTGSMSGMFTVLFFPWMVDRLGVKWVYMIGITAAVPCFSLFPIMNYLARGSIESSGELGLEVWVAIWLQVMMAVLVCTCYGAVSIFITTAAPNRVSLGATSGLAQVSVAIVRAIGIALATSMYSLSIDENHHYMNGGLVYYVTVALSLGGIWVGSLFPKDPWKDIG